jgi:D-3-phosphoglycerate dehydrogenase
MKKILISDPIDESCITTLKSAGFIVEYSTDLNPEELEKVVKDFNALVVRSSTKVTSKLISHMNKMEVIGRAGIGVDNIDVPSATRKGILVMNTPGGNTISAAEHTMALLLAVCRNIPQANKSLSEEEWDRKSFKGTELNGKKLGLIGLGKIGREVALRSKAFGLYILAFDPVLSSDVAEEIGVELVDLESIWKEADIISVHAPLYDRTKHIISADAIEKCKVGVKIINCARGGLVDEEALLAALELGKVSGAGLDVYEKEPPDSSNQLLKHPKVVCTPHLGASTEEAQQKVALQISEQIVDYFSNSIIKGAVNTLSIQDGIPSAFKPFLNLSEVLGKLHAQLLSGALKKININYSGELLHNSSQLLTTGFLKGFLSVELSDPVNYINAPIISQERGLIVDETKSGEHSDYNNIITITINTDEKELHLAGTVFGSSDIRIVRINNYHVEFKPIGNVLIYFNTDKPGMLASVSKLLAEAKINIANLALGRIEEGQDALTVINVDNVISEDIFKSVFKIDGIKDIYSVYI